MPSWAGIRMYSRAIAPTEIMVTMAKIHN